MNEALARKRIELKDLLGRYDRMAVAFSAGVDSTLLLALAHEVLGDGLLAITAVSDAFPAREAEEAAAFCRERGIRQVSFPLNEREMEGFALNPPDRCYRCKRRLFERARDEAAAWGIAEVAEGSIVDDLDERRPGMRALEELGVLRPLLECGFTKRDVRELSREMGLFATDKPSMTCLYTRFAFGESVDSAMLARVGQAEELIMGLGFSVVRVRVRDNDARVEVDAGDIERAISAPIRKEIVRGLRRLGFSSIALDLEGYRRGSMEDVR